MNTTIPEGYKSLLSMYDTQKAISLIHRLFEDRLIELFEEEDEDYTDEEEE